MGKTRISSIMQNCIRNRDRSMLTGTTGAESLIMASSLSCSSIMLLDVISEMLGPVQADCRSLL